MQDPATGAFRPQEMSYLREAPCRVLLEAFRNALQVRASQLKVSSGSNLGTRHAAGRFRLARENEV